MVHFTDNPEEGHCPKFVLFLDHSSCSLVLAIRYTSFFCFYSYFSCSYYSTCGPIDDNAMLRGTFSLKDVVLDIVCEEQPFLTGTAVK